MKNLKPLLAIAVLFVSGICVSCSKNENPTDKQKTQAIRAMNDEIAQAYLEKTRAKIKKACANYKPVAVWQYTKAQLQILKPIETGKNCDTMHNWSKIKPGMTGLEVVNLIGRPTGWVNTNPIFMSSTRPRYFWTSNDKKYTLAIYLGYDFGANSKVFSIHFYKGDDYKKQLREIIDKRHYKPLQPK